MSLLVKLLVATRRDRSGASAQALWRSLPAVYRQCAVFYSDFWVSYPVAFPSNRHRAVGKADATPRRRQAQGNAHQAETGLTSYIERFNGTLRQRVSQLIRKTLSFSILVLILYKTF